MIDVQLGDVTIGREGCTRIAEFEIAVTDEDWDDLDIDWMDMPGEDIKDLIEEKMGHRPDGSIYDLNISEPITGDNYRVTAPARPFYDVSVSFISYLDGPPEPQGVDIEAEPPVSITWKGAGDDRTDDAIDALNMSDPGGFSRGGTYSGSFEIDVEKDAHTLLQEMNEELEELQRMTGPTTQAAGTGDSDGGSWTEDTPTETCPGCDEEFTEGTGVDGDDGTPFCSLSCLNEHMNR